MQGYCPVKEKAGHSFTATGLASIVPCLVE